MSLIPVNKLGQEAISSAHLYVRHFEFCEKHLDACYSYEIDPIVMIFGTRYLGTDPQKLAKGIFGKNSKWPIYDPVTKIG